MSFLLDALRKSERTAAGRTVPTIHSGGPEPGLRPWRLRPAWRWILPVPVFLLGGWLALHWYTAPPAAPIAAEPAAGTTAGRSDPVHAEGGQPGEVSVEAQRPRISPAQAGTPAPAGQRTPVETLLPDPALNELVIPESDDRFAASAAVTVSERGRGPAEGVPGATGKQPQGMTPNVAVPVDPQNPALAGSAPAVTPPPPEAREDHIDYRQLPGDVRAQLPEFQITVLVYAEQPADRFILVNGSRQVEGDELQPGLVLQEIRRDGAVYSYRRYRFLVSQ